MTGTQKQTGSTATTPGVAGERTAQLTGVKTSAMLPFAGASLRGALLTALALILLGSVMRRAGRARKQRGGGHALKPLEGVAPARAGATPLVPADGE